METFFSLSFFLSLSLQTVWVSVCVFVWNRCQAAGHIETSQCVSLCVCVCARLRVYMCVFVLFPPLLIVCGWWMAAMCTACYDTHTHAHTHTERQKQDDGAPVMDHHGVTNSPSALRLIRTHGHRHLQACWFAANESAIPCQPFAILHITALFTKFVSKWRKLLWFMPFP